jgi:hypothetical protein
MGLNRLRKFINLKPKQPTLTGACGEFRFRLPLHNNEGYIVSGTSALRKFRQR